MRHVDQAPQHSEIEQSERELACAGWDLFEQIVPVAVSGRRQFHLVDDEVGLGADGGGHGRPEDDGHLAEDRPGAQDPGEDRALALDRRGAGHEHVHRPRRRALGHQQLARGHDAGGSVGGEGEQLGQGRENVKVFLAENVDLMVEISEKVKNEVGINEVGPLDLPAEEESEEAVEIDG